MIDDPRSTLKKEREAYLILESQSLSPSAHHKGIIGGDDSNLINTLCFEFVVFLNVWRQMVGVAGWLERDLGTMS